MILIVATRRYRGQSVSVCEGDERGERSERGFVHVYMLFLIGHAVIGQLCS